MSFFVTTIAYYPEDEEKRYDRPYKCVHTFGHFPTLETAQGAVARNDGEMYECLYNYLVIEEVAYGIYGRITSSDPDDPSKGEWWYKWDHPNWVPMDKPDWSKGLIGWAIG